MITVYHESWGITLGISVWKKIGYLFHLTKYTAGGFLLELLQPLALLLRPYYNQNSALLQGD